MVPCIYPSIPCPLKISQPCSDPPNSLKFSPSKILRYTVHTYMHTYIHRYAHSFLQYSSTVWDSLRLAPMKWLFACGIHVSACMFESFTVLCQTIDAEDKMLGNTLMDPPICTCSYVVSLGTCPWKLFEWKVWVKVLMELVMVNCKGAYITV